MPKLKKQKKNALLKLRKTKKLVLLNKLKSKGSPKSRKKRESLVRSKMLKPDLLVSSKRPM